VEQRTSASSNVGTIDLKGDGYFDARIGTDNTRFAFDEKGRLRSVKLSDQFKNEYFGKDFSAVEVSAIEANLMSSVQIIERRNPEK
jgi:hypothetical protein